MMKFGFRFRQGKILNLLNSDTFQIGRVWESLSCFAIWSLSVPRRVNPMPHSVQLNGLWLAWTIFECLEISPLEGKTSLQIEHLNSLDGSWFPLGRPSRALKRCAFFAIALASAVVFFLGGSKRGGNGRTGKAGAVWVFLWLRRTSWDFNNSYISPSIKKLKQKSTKGHIRFV